MENQNHSPSIKLRLFIVSLAAFLCLTNVILAFSAYHGVEDYFLVNAAIYFAVNILYGDKVSQWRRVLSIFSAIIFMGFLAIVIVEVIKILK